MENLIRFLVKFSSLLLFLCLEIVAISLIVNQNNYHRSVFLSTSNVVGGNVLSAVDMLTGYFDLRHNNDLLSKENTALKNELLKMSNRMSAYEDTIKDSVYIDADKNYHYIRAKVIGNTVNKFQNYVTLNKGKRDGVKPDMGVVCSEGIVGVVETVSDHFCVVLPLLNPQAKISCRLDSCKNFGSLVWDGVNPMYANLEEIPRHVPVRLNETLSTSGFSSIFPEGIPAGTVVEKELKESDNFYSIKVLLSTDFRRLSYVDIIVFANSAELKGLERSIK
ncbi:MAG: rod shape-determining protein MreC [Bacteroidia bacterium]|nr:rod shape-determining protein MreC [Bacteroidia bacterium]